MAKKMTKVVEEKKGFFARLFSSCDQGLKQKSEESCCCCSAPKKKKRC